MCLRHLWRPCHMVTRSCRLCYLTVVPTASRLCLVLEGFKLGGPTESGVCFQYLLYLTMGSLNHKNTSLPWYAGQICSSLRLTWLFFNTVEPFFAVENFYFRNFGEHKFADDLFREIKILPKFIAREILLLHAVSVEQRVEDEVQERIAREDTTSTTKNGQQQLGKYSVVLVRLVMFWIVMQSVCLKTATSSATCLGRYLKFILFSFGVFRHWHCFL